MKHGFTFDNTPRDIIMKKSSISLLLAAACAMPVLSQAQNPPQGVIAAARGNGEAAVGEAIQLQGTVKAIDKQKRSVTVVGPQGNELVINAGPEARNFDQVAIGDLVTLTYTQAVALELIPVGSGVAPGRQVTEAVARTEPGQKPGGVIETTVRILANVVAVNPKAQVVTLKGPERTVELSVKDPAVLAKVKVGQQVEAVFVEAIAIAVTPAAK
jgi:Cu/Ag efflux protein CusF